MWNRGSTPNIRSAGRIPSPGASVWETAAFDRRFSWLNNTPLGWPVVPEVYG
jgi:hypothetical protein